MELVTLELGDREVKGSSLPLSDLGVVLTLCFIFLDAMMGASGLQPLSEMVDRGLLATSCSVVFSRSSMLTSDWKAV